MQIDDNNYPAQIASVLTEYCNRMEHTKWLVDNGHLPPDTNVGKLVYESTLRDQSTYIIEAVVTMLGLANREHARCAAFMAAYNRNDDDKAEWTRLTNAERDKSRDMRLQALHLSRIYAAWE